MRLFVFICLLISCHSLAAQQGERATIEGALQQYKDLDNDPQLLLLERSLQKAESAFTAIDTTTAKVYKAIAEWYTRNIEFEEALEFSKRELAALKALEKYPDLTAEAYTETAQLHIELHEFGNAQLYFQQSQKLNKGQDQDLDFHNYLGLATVLLSQGNFNLQIEHAKYAYDLAETPSDKCSALHVQFQGYARLGNIAACNRSIEEQLELSKEHKLAYCRGRAYTSLGWVNNIKARKLFVPYKRELRKAKSENPELRAAVDLEKMTTLKQKADASFKTARSYYDKGVSYMKGSGHEDEMRTISWAYKNISNQYKSLGNMELSIQYAKLAIQENKSFFNKEYYPELADFYHNLSTKYSLKKKYGGPEDYESALRQIQNAIKCLLRDESFSDSREIIPTEQLYKVSIKWQLLTELKEKALCYAHLYIEHKNKADLESAERHLSNAVELIDIMRAELSTDDTKIFWRKRTRFIYDTAIEMAEWLGDNEKVLKYMEKSRALLLLDELNNKDAKALIPERLAEREKTLREAFVDANETNVIKYKSYNAFLDSLRVAYPSYYKYKFAIRTPSITDVQKEIIDDSTQILSYHITPDSLYLLNITSTSSQLITQPRPKNLKADVGKLLSLVSNKDSLEYASNYKTFLEISQRLHGLLFSKVSRKGNKIIVIGDGVIDYVPFDLLVSSVVDGVPRYLIQDYVFSSAPSLSVLQKYQEQRSFNKLLMISPGSFDDKSMTPLVQSADEIQHLKQVSNTRILDQEKATLGNFVTICDDYDVIHFSTHSGIDEKTKEPWIAFQDSLISLNEIYKLNLNASLVTLSSCKSFHGEGRTSEGVNSLARAFLFSDAASVIGSMWNLNEAAGHRILMDFYSSLKNKKDKPTALREAKLNYIKKNKHKSPYYWAPLVLVGDPVELESSSEQSEVVILYGILGLIFLFFLLGMFVRK